MSLVGLAAAFAPLVLGTRSCVVYVALPVVIASLALLTYVAAALMKRKIEMEIRNPK